MSCSVVRPRNTLQPPILRTDPTNTAFLIAATDRSQGDVVATGATIQPLGRHHALSGKMEINEQGPKEEDPLKGMDSFLVDCAIVEAEEKEAQDDWRNDTVDLGKRESALNHFNHFLEGHYSRLGMKTP